MSDAPSFASPGTRWACRSTASRPTRVVDPLTSSRRHRAAHVSRRRRREAAAAHSPEERGARASDSRTLTALAPIAKLVERQLTTQELAVLLQAQPGWDAIWGRICSRRQVNNARHRPRERQRIVTVHLHRHQRVREHIPGPTARQSAPQRPTAALHALARAQDAPAT